LYPPINLGFGSMADTGLATAYAKGSLTVNADGSFAILMQPTIGAGVGIKGINTNNAGLAVPTWAQVTWPNESAINVLATEARIVSGALRVMGLQALTAAPGLLYAGHINSSTANLNTTTTAQLLSNYPTSKTGIGPEGCFITLRPLDTDFYVFSPSTMAQTNGAIPWFWPTIYAAGTGFPAGTSIFWEACINVEYVSGILDTNVNTIIDGESEPRLSETLATTYASVEQAWNYASRLLPTAVKMSAKMLEGDFKGAAFDAFNSHSAHTRTLPRNNFFTIEDID